jgi:hypothetical protein
LALILGGIHFADGITEDIVTDLSHSKDLFVVARNSSEVYRGQGLSLAFFFGEQHDTSVKYRLLVKESHALDYAFLAMANAYLGRMGEAEAAAANAMKLDPTWIAERYLSEAGGYAEKEAELFVNGALKAGLPACIPADKLTDMPNLIRVKSYDQQRVKLPGR